MSQLQCDRSRCDQCRVCIDACPFGAIEMLSDGITFNEACRLCRICIKRCPKQAISLQQTQEGPTLNRADYQGVLVFAEQREGHLQPVTYELIGKGRELADKVGQQVYVALAGHQVADAAQELRHYGVDRVLVYDDPELRHFRAELFTDVLDDAVAQLMPNVILIGATAVGRSLAPRLATRLRTGLTADCTILDIRPNGDLVQTRPAFGGNVMATILTPKHRPQMATVRYKVMEAAQRQDSPRGEIIHRPVSPDWSRKSRVLEVVKQAQTSAITDADIVIAVGRGIKSDRDLAMIEDLAQSLGAMVGCTRPLVEKGWLPNSRQIGLSGRTVRPQLLIAAGISGAIQFVAGMRSSDVIFAINQDKNAPIFDVAHYALVGDLYQIVPELVSSICEGGETRAL